MRQDVRRGSSRRPAPRVAPCSATVSAGSRSSCVLLAVMMLLSFTLPLLLAGR